MEVSVSRESWPVRWQPVRAEGNVEHNLRGFSVYLGGGDSQAPELCADANRLLLRQIELERGATALEMARLETLSPAALEGLLRVRLHQHFLAAERAGY
jgi:hypothetical protein